MRDPGRRAADARARRALRPRAARVGPEEVEGGGGALAATPPGLAACATDWVGDLTRRPARRVQSSLADLSGFGAIPDRLQQAHVNFSFLGRLLNSPDGAASDPAFRDAAGTPVFGPSASRTFVGNSQGGILGGAASFGVDRGRERVVLGVPGMNYSMLLTRSDPTGTRSPPSSSRLATPTRSSGCWRCR